MSSLINPNSSTELSELSEAELDTISGGFDVAFSASMFEESDEFSMQETSGRGGRRGFANRSMARTRKRSGSQFQFVGTGFESVNDVMTLLSGFAKFFGR